MLTWRVFAEIVTYTIVSAIPLCTWGINAYSYMNLFPLRLLTVIFFTIKVHAITINITTCVAACVKILAVSHCMVMIISKTCQ